MPKPKKYQNADEIDEDLKALSGAVASTIVPEDALMTSIKRHDLAEYLLDHFSDLHKMIAALGYDIEVIQQPRYILGKREDK